jgi:hypothetical protein
MAQTSASSSVVSAQQGLEHGVQMANFSKATFVAKKRNLTKSFGFWDFIWLSLTSPDN